jgi:hypothetical protein
MADYMRAQRLLQLVDLGRSNEVLREAESLCAQAEARHSLPILALARSAQLRLLAEQGAGAAAAATAEEFLARTRSTDIPWALELGLGAAARCQLAAGQRDQAIARLRELAQQMAAHEAISEPVTELVRCALSTSDLELAKQLMHSFRPTTPLRQHALLTVRAAISEAAGKNPREAARLYAEAAQRWHTFGNLPERAYALLGQGRCLRALDHPETEHPLNQARELFASMGYQPALTEAEALLHQEAAT